VTGFLDLINYWERINRMSRDKLMEEGNKLIARAQALDNKEKSIKSAYRPRKCDNKRRIC
jgi:hypothetical protein